MKNISLTDALNELGWTKEKSSKLYAYRIFDQEGRLVGDFTAKELTEYFDRHRMFQEEEGVSE